MMKKSTKIWLMVATLLILAGAIPFTAIMALQRWDFKILNTVQYETNTHEIQESFENIAVTTDTADIVFLPCADGKCQVICYEKENEKHAVLVENNTLTVRLIDERDVTDFIGFHFGEPKITVYLPENEYKALFIDGHTGKVTVPEDFRFEGIDISVTTSDVFLSASALKEIKIHVSTGDIHVEHLSAASVDLTYSTGRVIANNVYCTEDFSANGSTGDVVLADLQCKNLTTDTGSGDVSLQNTIASENFKIKTGTGKVTFTDCDAAELSVQTSTGDVSGNLLSEKIFLTETSTGSIDVPKSTTGGVCEIKTGTGNIKITTP